MLGTSVSRLDGSHLSSVNKIARAFGAILQPATKGLYICSFDAGKKELACTKLNPGSAGVHEAFWVYFKARLRLLSSDLLSSRIGTIANNQIASAKLSELSDNLSGDPATGGSWLSFMRNEVNYSQRWGTWFPYEGYRATDHDRLHDGHANWTEDPLAIDLTSYQDRDLIRFQQTCHFLVALCRVLTIDMSRRCSTGTSFQAYGPLAILNLLGQKRTARPAK